MPPATADAAAAHDVDWRIAQRLARLRADRGWSLDVLAERTGISRATLSRLERSELSPTAAMLGTLCSIYGWTLSRFMAEAETQQPNLVAASQQTEWKDPESGYWRRIVSPPTPGLRAELVDVHLPAGATVSFDSSPIAGLEHHLWMLEGTLTLQVEASTFRLRPGDCLRYVLAGPSRFHNSGKREARYVIAMVRP
jgi:transcriptional regulator with XRE-family HTH domain